MNFHTHSDYVYMVFPLEVVKLLPYLIILGYYALEVLTKVQSSGVHRIGFLF
jgi:hypothetical protein